jgi:transcriptional regulator with XRE-family HTH domain
MSTIGERIYQERERLSLTQPEVAELCGVTMRSQRNYEHGDRSPDAEYLAALAANGLDVLYILTGQRAGFALSPEEQTMLGFYRDATKDVRRAALGALVGAAPAAPLKSPAESKKSTKVKVSNKGVAGVQIGYVEGSVQERRK